jgi:hypothetical protein
MENLWTLIIVPILIGVIILVIEYFIIRRIPRNKGSQPASRRKQVQPQPSRSSSPEWTTARDRAIERFRAQQHKYNWLEDNINIENFQVDKGLGVLTIEVVTTSILRRPDRIVSIADTGPWVIARYELTIDRTGDILKIWSIPKYLWPLTER